MKHLKILFGLLIGLSFTLTGCIDDVEVDDFNQGTADFSNYVALGNSLTAGFIDGTLVRTAQENSYPSLLSQSMNFAGANNSFNIPLTVDDIGGLTLGGNPIPGFENRLVLNESLGIERLAGTSSNEVTNNLASQGPFQNLGIPGAKSFQLLFPGFGNLSGLATDPISANPFYIRFANENESVLANAMAQDPTFFTLWIGNNDALTFASAGGAADELTDPSDFATFYGALLQGLTANGAQGIVANVPSVTDLPFFTVVPPAPLAPRNADGSLTAFGQQIPTLNQTYGLLNQIFTQVGASERIITFTDTEANPVVIRDTDLADLSAVITGAIQNTPGVDPSIVALAPILGQQYGQARQLGADELITLPASSVIGTVNNARLAELISFGVPPETAGQFSVNGVTLPMESNLILTRNELLEISSSINAYNQSIDAVAAQFGVPVIDMNTFFSDVTNTGISFSGSTFTTTFVTGGLFSLDGIHPTEKGYAVVANIFIDEINNAYNSNLPTVDVNNFPGVALP